MSEILFIGDVNVDIVLDGLKQFPVRDKEITCDGFEITMGSSSAFAACSYALLGGRGSFLGLAGRDEYGRFMVRGLEECGLNTRLVQYSESIKTGVTVNLVHEGSRTQVTYPGTIAELGAGHIPPAVFRDFDHLYFAGIYQQYQLRPDLARLLRAAAESGITVSLDPQWDESEEWADMAEWLPLLTWLFVNADEAMSITRTETVEKAWQALAAQTPCPIVKAGNQGCLVPGPNGPMCIPAFPVRMVDTIGAGDAFAAAFLYGLKVKKHDRRGSGPAGKRRGRRQLPMPGRREP